MSLAELEQAHAVLDTLEAAEAMALRKAQKG
jgi:hypothetical protein